MIDGQFDKVEDSMISRRGRGRSVFVKAIADKSRRGGRACCIPLLKLRNIGTRTTTVQTRGSASLPWWCVKDAAPCRVRGRVVCPHVAVNA